MSEANGETKAPPPPRLSDGRRLIFGWVLDAEHGPVRVGAPDVSASVLLRLLDQARAEFGQQWRDGMAQHIGKLMADAERRIVVPSGVIQ